MTDRPKTDPARLRLIHDRFKRCQDAEHDLRQRQLEDQRFDASDQWDAGIKATRQANGQPCLTINRIHGGVKQVTNEQRRNPPSIQVNPVDDLADVETAEVLQALMRQIETRSRADIAYETAGEAQARIGLGYFRIYTQYIKPKSRQQQILIKRILNRFSVYVDPAAQEFDKRDMRFAFITADITKDEYTAQHPKSELATMDTSAFTGLGDAAKDWISAETYRVAEYLYVEETPDPDGLLPERRVKWCKVNAVEVLEERDLPGTRIPLIPVIGDEVLDDNGRVDYRGIVRDAKDPARITNAMESSIVEQIGLGPRAPYLMLDGQDEGYEQDWKQANRRNLSALKYRPVELPDGSYFVQAPQRNVLEPPIQATVLAAQRAENNQRAVMGFVDVHGEERQGPEQSGRAILARQQQAETGNLHYLDNLGRAVQSAGELLLEWIPVVYDVPQVLRITGADDQLKTVMVHAGNPPPELAQMGQDQFLQQRGIKGVYDLSAGQYDVTITTGPSYQTRRQEAVASMVEFVRAYPAAFPIIGDVLTKHMDWPGAQQVSARLKKMLPQNLQDQEAGTGPTTEQLQQQLQQVMEQHTQLVEALKVKTAEVEMDQAKAQATLEATRMTNESRERIAALQAQASLVKVQTEQHGQAALASLQGSIDAILMRLDHQHDLSEQREARAHQSDEASADRDQAKEIAASKPPPNGAEK